MRRLKKAAAPRSPAHRQALIYARVSSKEQDKEGFSIPAQLKLLRDYALGENLPIAEEYVDVETAKQAGRVNFGRMVDYLGRHPDARTVLVEKTDRLYRNLKDWVTLDELDLEIHFVKEGVVLSPDARSSEKFMHGIKVLMAKNYIDNLSEETRKGMLEKAAQGIWPSFAPLGYCNVVGDDGKKTIVQDPDMAPLVRQMFEWYASGRHSVREITRMAKAAGLAFRKTRSPVPQSSVHKMLRNRIYMGDFTWDGKRYEGRHEPIVDRALWEQVQSVLDGRYVNRNRKSKYDFVYSGLIRCGHCGCSMVAELKKGRYVYYHCSRAKGKCPEPYTREELLDEKFAELLDRLRFDDEVLEWVTCALRSSHEDEKRHHDEAVKRLQAEYERLQRRIDAMYVDKLDGRIDAGFFDRHCAEWRAEQDRCLSAIAQHRDADEDYLDEGIGHLELAQKAGVLFRRRSSAEKRRLLEFVRSNSTWKDGELGAVYRQPFDLLAENVVCSRRSGDGGGRQGAFLRSGSPWWTHFEFCAWRPRSTSGSSSNRFGSWIWRLEGPWPHEPRSIFWSTWHPSAINDSIWPLLERYDMAQLIVRNLEDEVIQALKRRAGLHGRSAEAEHREILRAALLESRTGRSLKEHLLDMPSVGDDSDFARQEDIGREVEF